LSAGSWIFELRDYIPFIVRRFKFAQGLSGNGKRVQVKCAPHLRTFKLDAGSCRGGKAGRYVESVMLTMDFLVTDPEHWRERAESIRLTANLLNDAGTKARMLKIAEGYEVLGRQTEQRRHTGW
jgi:hypothetical protein